MARTLAEADVHGVSLMRSALEHAVVTGHAIIAGRVFVPLTTGRTATEHAVRSQYLPDSNVSDLERASRRMNEWLHAIQEREWQRMGIVSAGHPGAGDIEDGARQLRLVEERVAALGLTLRENRKGRQVAELEARPGPMLLSERYLSDAEANGVTTATFKAKHAVTHGLEKGLLSASVEAPSSYEVQLMRPQQPVPGDLAYLLMQVPLSAFNSTRSMAVLPEIRGQMAFPLHELSKIRPAKLDRRAAAVSASLDDVAPERSRTGLFGAIDGSGSGEPLR